MGIGQRINAEEGGREAAAVRAKQRRGRDCHWHMASQSHAERNKTKGNFTVLVQMHQIQLFSLPRPANLPGHVQKFHAKFKNLVPWHTSLEMF